MRFKKIKKDVENLEYRYRHIRPKLPPNPLKGLAVDQQLFLFQFVDGLMVAIETRSWNEKGLNNILGTADHPWGIDTQVVFDFLEGRNGPIDQENRRWIIRLMKTNIGKAKVEKLLEDLHIHLIREVMDPNRPYLRAMCGDDGQRLLHEEFGVDVRCPSLLTKWGPTECRLNPDDEKNWPPQYKLTERLKIAYEKNCIGWKEMVRHYTMNNFPKSKSVANSREYPNSKIGDNNIGS